MAIPFFTPNFYQLHGQGLHISFSTTGVDGISHFTYQDTGQPLSFSGDEIQQVNTGLGTIVSVSIRKTIDTGSTIFSLFVPRINLSGQEALPISTGGVTTVHRFSNIPKLNHGQLDTYTVIKLMGTASKSDH